MKLFKLEKANICKVAILLQCNNAFKTNFEEVQLKSCLEIKKFLK